MTHPILILMSGLPGCGKSTVSQLLKTILSDRSFYVVASDQVRKELFPMPTYSAEESARAHLEARRRILALLSVGQSVIYDATNLRQSDRAWRYEAERQTGCCSLLIEVTLDEATTLARLAVRSVAQDSVSDADAEIYYLLRDSAEKIVQPHFTVRTDDHIDADMAPVIARLR